MADIQKAASIMGRIGGKSRSQRKVDAVKRNLEKAYKALSAQQRKERAKKAAEARWKKKSR